MTGREHRLLRIALAGFGDIEEWRLGDPARAAAKGYPREFAAGVIDDWGILFADLAIDARTGTLVCHEINGPNAVGSDALTGDSPARADAEARHAVRRASELGHLGQDGRLLRPVVTIHAHQHWRTFRTGGEFYPRVGLFAGRLEARLPGHDVMVRGAREPLGDEQVSVVVGDVPSVAAELGPGAGGRFVYRGRPVVFIGNPNLLPELARTRKLHWANGCAPGVDLRVFHMSRLLRVIHDKALQQALLEGTGIRPLARFEARTRDEAVRGARRLLAHGPVVLKPNGGSGGVGIHVVTPEMTDEEIGARVELLLRDCAAKYGENAEATAFPVRGFEFVRATGYPMPDGERLWDLRIALELEPGRVRAYPVSMRVTPDPFDERTFHLGRNQWITNVSGRDVTLLRSGLDDDALGKVGMTPERIEEALRACVRWTLNAWDAAVRDAGTTGVAYEDECERADPEFYRRRLPGPGGA